MRASWPPALWPFTWPEVSPFLSLQSKTLVKVASLDDSSSLALCLSSWASRQAGITPGPSLTSYSARELSHIETDSSAGILLGTGSLGELVSQPEQSILKGQPHRYIIRKKSGIHDTLMCNRLGNS